MMHSFGRINLTRWATWVGIAHFVLTTPRVVDVIYVPGPDR